MTKKERQVFQEENRFGYLMITLACIAGIHMCNSWKQINPQEATTGDAVATIPARPTDDLMQ